MLRNPWNKKSFSNGYVVSEQPLNSGNGSPQLKVTTERKGVILVIGNGLSDLLHRYRQVLMGSTYDLMQDESGQPLAVPKSRK